MKFQKQKLYFCHFRLLDPDPDSESGSTDQVESGSNPDPKHWFFHVMVKFDDFRPSFVAAMGELATFCLESAKK
jgi:hypothetical protein